MTSPFANEGWNYGYDDLYRMTTSTNLSDSNQSQTFSYDAIGRITSNSRIGSYIYPNVGLARPHAPTQTTGTINNQYQYDPNGNLTTGAGRTLTWDANNRITQAAVASTTVNFTYDGLGTRLKKATSSSTSRYPLGDDYEITNGLVTKYIKVEGLGAVAKRVGAGGSIVTYWLHTDRLGSIQAITDSSAEVVVQRRTYRPYGEKIADATGHVESEGWLGERNDPETGLQFLHARYYDPALGTFVSPDPMHPANAGVGLNRYGYGFGNPAAGIDPSGLVVCTWVDGFEFCPPDDDEASNPYPGGYDPADQWYERHRDRRERGDGRRIPSGPIKPPEDCIRGSDCTPGPTPPPASTCPGGEPEPCPETPIPCEDCGPPPGGGTHGEGPPAVNVDPLRGHNPNGVFNSPNPNDLLRRGGSQGFGARFNTATFGRGQPDGCQTFGKRAGNNFVALTQATATVMLGIKIVEGTHGLYAGGAEFVGTRVVGRIGGRFIFSGATVGSLAAVGEGVAIAGLGFGLGASIAAAFGGCYVP